MFGLFDKEPGERRDYTQELVARVMEMIQKTGSAVEIGQIREA
jgi:hypothetical protein